MFYLSSEGLRKDKQYKGKFYCSVKKVYVSGGGNTYYVSDGEATRAEVNVFDMDESYENNYRMYWWVYGKDIENDDNKYYAQDKYLPKIAGYKVIENNSPTSMLPSKEASYEFRFYDVYGVFMSREDRNISFSLVGADKDLVTVSGTTISIKAEKVPIGGTNIIVVFSDGKGDTIALVDYQFQRQKYSLNIVNQFPNNVNVTLDDGSPVSATYEWGQAINLSASSTGALTFNGWTKITNPVVTTNSTTGVNTITYSSSSSLSSNPRYTYTMPAGEATLYPTYSGQTIRVDLDTMGGVNATGGAMPAYIDATFLNTYSTLPNLTIDSLYFEEFDGWYTSIGGTGTKITNDSIVNAEGKHTLYANFLPKKYDVNLIINGEIAETFQVGYGYNYPKISNPTDISGNHSFLGWYDSLDDDALRIDYRVTFYETDEVNLYAFWCANYTNVITYVVDENTSFTQYARFGEDVVLRKQNFTTESSERLIGWKSGEDFYEFGEIITYPFPTDVNYQRLSTYPTDISDLDLSAYNMTLNLAKATYEFNLEVGTGDVRVGYLHTTFIPPQTIG